MMSKMDHMGKMGVIEKRFIYIRIECGFPAYDLFCFLFLHGKFTQGCGVIGDGMIGKGAEPYVSGD